MYGAHTTAADALWAGLPLLTLRGFGVGTYIARPDDELLPSRPLVPKARRTLCVVFAFLLRSPIGSVG